MLSPTKGPMHGMQSPATSNGPKQRQKAIHMTIKPTRRNAQVNPVASLANWSKKLPVLTVPMRKSDNVNPEQSHEDGAVHLLSIPLSFFPNSVAFEFLGLLLFSLNF